MKLTVNLDNALLERVVKITGASTKTEAIHTALREVDRRARLIEVLREGDGATAEERGSLFDPASDPEKLRAAEEPSAYGAKK
ncbi:MAG: type II toxin-antitoxin system VapB family antitoxin [Verrucomicrobiota bacterium]